MKKYMYVVLIAQASLIQALPYDDFLIDSQTNYATPTEKITKNNLVDNYISQLVRYTCDNSYAAHRSDFDMNIRTEQGQLRVGGGIYVSIANKHTRDFIETIINDIAQDARNLQVNDREEFWRLASENVTSKMASFCNSHKGADFGIEALVKSNVILKKAIWCNSVEFTPQLAASVSSASFAIHRYDFDMNIRTEQGRLRVGGGIYANIANNHTRSFINTVINDLAEVACNLQWSDEEEFWKLSSEHVTNSMTSFCNSHNGTDFGIRSYVQSQVNLEKNR